MQTFAISSKRTYINKMWAGLQKVPQNCWQQNAVQAGEKNLLARTSGPKVDWKTLELSAMKWCLIVSFQLCPPYTKIPCSSTSFLPAKEIIDSELWLSSWVKEDGNGTIIKIRNMRHILLFKCTERQEHCYDTFRISQYLPTTNTLGNKNALHKDTRCIYILLHSLSIYMYIFILRNCLCVRQLI